MKNCDNGVTGCVIGGWVANVYIYIYICKYGERRVIGEAFGHGKSEGLL